MLKNIAVIGCGYWGKNLVRNFSELGVLGAICDLDEVIAEKTSVEYKVPAASYDEILNNDEIIGVVIAAPAAQHAALVEKALVANKHVFIEKPLALNIAQAQQLCELAEKKQRILMVGHLLQYHPAYIELKRLITAGNLGKLQYIYSNRLNLGKFRNEENILWSFAPHDISMILGIVGELPYSVYATGACHLNKAIHDVTTTHLIFKNEIQAHIFVSWLHPYKEQKLVVIGERGMAVFDDSLTWHEKLQIYPHQIKWTNGFPIPTKAASEAIKLQELEPLRLECQHFLACIASNTQPKTNSLEGLHVLQVLAAAEQSLQTKMQIPLEDIVTHFYKHETAIVEQDCQIGKNSKIWHFSHIFGNTSIGKNCVIGQNVMIGPKVSIGHGCKIQNNVSIYEGVTLEDNVFCGPSCVFTNVYNPRAHIERKKEYRKTHVEQGVTIGANATIVCGVRLGQYSFIGAGAVVTKDVKPHALMVGNPAKQIGWMSRIGEKLGPDLICPREGRAYFINQNQCLEEIEYEPTIG